MRRLKAAIVGTGAISKEHLAFLESSERAQLVATCDCSRASARYAAERYGASGFYTNVQEMLCKAQPDVVHVLTPPTSHAHIVAACLQSGRHVICEKPLAPSHAQFRRLWALAQERGLYLIEDQNYRFNEPVVRLVGLVEEGALGEIRDVEVYFGLNIRGPGSPYGDENLPNSIHQMPGGAIHDFITHMCYLALMFVPAVDRVSAVWRNLGGEGPFGYDDLDALAIGETAHARLRFNAATAPSAFSITVRGTKGQAEVELLEPYIRTVVPRPGAGPFAPLVSHLENGIGLIGASVGNFYRKLVQKSVYEGIPVLLRDSYEAIATGGAPPVSFDDMDRASHLVDALVSRQDAA